MEFSRYMLLPVVPGYGDGEIRTLDPLLARQVLSQLSYAPVFFFFYAGSHLLSHAVSSTVSSAAHVLTAVFGMFYGCAPRAHRRQLSFCCFTKAAQQWNNPYF